MDVKIGSDKWMAIIREGAADFGVVVDDEAMSGFTVHALEMVEFNRKMNLTAITDPFEIAVKHVIDSLAAAPYISGNEALLDIGSGAGFPGIPLKLVHPAVAVTLIDASTRKVSFLKHIIRCLHVDGMVAHQMRVARLATNQKKRYDIVIMRALGSMEKCTDMALPLIKRETGIMVALRGPMTDSEIASLPRLIRDYLDCHPMEKKDFDLKVDRFSLPFTKNRRSIVIVRIFS